MELLHQIFPQWHIALDIFLLNLGTYVNPHYRTSPDNSTYDNWSSYGNSNPYTCQKGYNRGY